MVTEWHRRLGIRFTGPNSEMAAHLALLDEGDVEVLGAHAVPELVELDDVSLGDF